MELKVWCEGIQRVVCGVTEATTCQDIVIVLAQAIGKTGRYTLVERWRDNERLISPSESPLLVLSKWGEYANDVQFILRHSNGGSVLNSRHGNRSDGGSNRTSQIYDFSPHLSTKAHLSSSLRKSLTFSGAHSHSHLLSTRENGVCRHDRKCSIDKNSSLESLTESSHDAFTRSMPYLNANGDHRGLHNSSQSSQSSLATSSTKQSNHSVSQHSNIPFSYTSHPTTGGSLERTRRRNHSHYVHGRQSSDVSSTEMSTALKSGEVPPRSTRIDIPSSHSSGVFSHRRDLTLTSLAHDKPLSFPRALKPIPRESNNNIDMKMNANLTSVISDQIGDDSRARSDSTSSDNNEQTKKSELMKLINRQTEQIQQLEEKIKALETDISLIEHFDHEPNENTNTSEEIIRLKKHDLDLDSEIQELELVSWEGKLELEQAKEMRLRAEIEIMTKNLNNCNAELNKLNSKMKELDEEMAKEKHLRNVEEKRGKEQEARISAEISDLQKQITERQEEHKKRQKCLDETTNEKQNTEAEVGKKKARIAELEKELKETNLKTFIRSPSDLLRGSLEGRSLLRRLSPTRPGSARRLDVPQCLKEAVPTSKNPHGLWV